jgi:hypothetical protein
MTDLTHVELLWLEKQIERWIRFGRPADEQILDRRRRILSFTPGSVFGFVRWAANDYGTIASRIDILRAVRTSEACSTIPLCAARCGHPVADFRLAEGQACVADDRHRRRAGRRSLPTRHRTIGAISTVAWRSGKR